MRMHSDNYLSLFEDDHVKLSPEHSEWKILPVDDDENVHQATVLALTNTPLDVGVSGSCTPTRHGKRSNT